MVKLKACILVKTATGKFGEVINSLTDVEGVKRAFAVMGRTDVVVWAEVNNLKALRRLTYKIGLNPNVVASETLVGMEQ